MGDFLRGPGGQAQRSYIRESAFDLSARRLDGPGLHHECFKQSVCDRIQLRLREQLFPQSAPAIRRARHKDILKPCTTLPLRPQQSARPKWVAYRHERAISPIGVSLRKSEIRNL